jgi:predicted phosphoribosyltransferase
MPDRLFRDRRDAGRVLAGLLGRYRDRGDVVVLALPRGGVPVGYEVATALGAPLDVFLVRKLGVPGSEELAMGAIASGGSGLNHDVVRGLGIRPETVQSVAEREGRELLRREQFYREGRPPLDLAGKVVILVDDGLATGSSMLAAVNALQQHNPAQIVVVVPAAPEAACRELSAVVDNVVCATTPSPFFAVGQSYWDFTQTTDDEVVRLLREAANVRPAHVPTEVRPEVAKLRSELTTKRSATRNQDTVIDLVGDAHLVLLGKASHTLDALADHLSGQRGEKARIVVWGHNSHVGDSRATEAGSAGELTLGKVVREQNPGDCLLVGFTTYSGTVTAADIWGGAAERKIVRPALPGSFEELFHEVGEDSFAVPFRTAPRSADALRTARLQRAIGVIYRPSTERQSHYFRARLADQFDVVIHIDDTRGRRAAGADCTLGARRSARDLSTRGLIRNAEGLYCRTALTSLPSIT